MKKVWSCKIGFAEDSVLPWGADLPMRQAVEEAFKQLTGDWPEFIFSGWGAELTEAELAVVENRMPTRD